MWGQVCFLSIERALPSWSRLACCPACWWCIHSEGEAICATAGIPEQFGGSGGDKALACSQRSQAEVPVLCFVGHWIWGHLCGFPGPLIPHASNERGICWAVCFVGLPGSPTGLQSCPLLVVAGGHLQGELGWCWLGSSQGTPMSLRGWPTLSPFTDKDAVQGEAKPHHRCRLLPLLSQSFEAHLGMGVLMALPPALLNGSL